MRQWKTGVALSVAVLAAGLVLAPRAAQAQTFDHLTCAKVNKDDRLAKPPPPLTLTPEQAEFLASNNCKIAGANKVARAKQVCYATSKSPSNPPNGEDLSGQSFLCYRIKCDKNGGGKTPIDLTDQFGTGSVTVNQQPNTKDLCVPAFGPGTPTPVPTATPTPVVTTPTPTPVVTPTPPYGSASRAFVNFVASLLQ
jgi:hypothetical protein